MDFTQSFVLQQYAEMDENEGESSEDDDNASTSGDDDDDDDDDDAGEDDRSPISLETQYINAMVEKINLEHDKRHPEKSSQSIWDKLYGDMSDNNSSDSDVSNSSDDDDIDEAGDDDSYPGEQQGNDIAEDAVEYDALENDVEEQNEDMDEVNRLFIFGGSMAGGENVANHKIYTVAEASHEDEHDNETAEEKAERLADEKIQQRKKEAEDSFNEWSMLHQWLVDFRLKHNMTILDFLEYADAEEDMCSSWQVKQYLSRTGHRLKPSQCSTTWGGRVRALLRKLKEEVESGETSHRKYMQLRLLKYRSAEYSPDDELLYTLRFGYQPPVEEEVTISSNMFDDIESLAGEIQLEEINEQKENAHMAEEDDNKLHEKYSEITEDPVGMRSFFKYDSGSDVSESEYSFGDTDSSSGEEHEWVGGEEGHKMRKERRKMAREDVNVRLDIFDSVEEREAKRIEKETREKEEAEEAARCPSDIAGVMRFSSLCLEAVVTFELGQVAWRLKRFEEAKAKELEEKKKAEEEAKALKIAEKLRRKKIREKNKLKKETAMTVLRALKGETLFV